MVYTKTTWADSTVLTTTNLNNIETQYDEIHTYYGTHNHDTLYYTKTEMESNFWYAGNDGAGSGCDADLIYHASGNLHYADLISSGIAVNSIIMWEGAVGTIPSGWALCDGSGGTPDLRDKFVIGTSGTKAVGASGGNNTNNSTDTINVASYALQTTDIPSHRHLWYDAHGANTIGNGSDATGTHPRAIYATWASANTANAGSGTAHTHAGSTSSTSTSNLPPSVALYYIMKTS